MKKKYFIIDFDSSFISVEALDELARIALTDNPKKEKILKKIKEITNQGMEGKLAFNQSLSKRIKLFSANKTHINKLIKFLKRKITPSVSRNKNFFRKYADQIYIISGGFKEYIVPIMEPFGISKDHILANTFIFNKKGVIIGYDKKNLLSKEKGKVKAVEKLNLKGKIYVIGDGYTDYQIKESAQADKFFAFIENVVRSDLLGKADMALPNFDELLYRFHLPRALSYPKSRIKVLLLENIHPVAGDILRKEGYQVERLNYALGEKELKRVIKNVSVLGIRSKTKIPSNILQEAKKLLMVSAFCIGINQIDLSACSFNGTAVFNAPYSNTRSVVELVLAEIIILYRRLFDKSSLMQQGVWNKSPQGCHEVRGKKLGIIGYGNIGSQLSVIAEGLGMEVYFYDIVEKLALGNAKRCQSLRELFRVADVVTVHVDGRLSNKNLIGEREFKMMKDKVIFLNLSRGYVVDIKALVKNIKTGKIAGAGIDVFPKEPKSNKDPFVSELQKLPNVVLTPHIGGNTLEAQKNIGQFVASKIIEFINTGNTMMSVNLPNLQLPKLKRGHRFIHLHKNTPGVLAQINSLLAKYKINVDGQYLKTNERVGYVITDVNKKYGKEIIKALKEIPETLKFRVLY